MKVHGIRIPIVVLDAHGDVVAWTRHHEPLTLGIPMPRGAVTDLFALALHDRNGGEVPAQFEAVERWPDGSVRWLLADFQADTIAGGDARYELQDDGERVAPKRLCTVAKDGAVVVDTGPITFRCRPNGGCPFDDIRVGDRSIVDAASSGLIVEDRRGRRLAVDAGSLTVERDGPLRAVVVFDGTAGPRGRPTLLVSMRLEFFAGSTAVRVALTVRNPRRARHPGGRWQLGERSSVFLRRMAFRLAPEPADLDAAPVVRCSAEVGAAAECQPAPFELYQDSSGGPCWNGTVHVNRRGIVPARFRGYRMTAANGVREGMRATPAVVLRHGEQPIGFAVEQFWQNSPKAMEATPSAVELGLFPHQYADVHEIQGGEQKTHTFVMLFGADTVSDGAYEWVRSPLLARCTPEWYAHAGAVRFLTPASVDPHRLYLRLVQSAIDGHDTLFDKREAIDEYGWRNFGDLYADHEAVFAKGPSRLVSHYNNQYDAVAAFACQFFRSGDRRWWTLMDDLARHVVDIDVYHTEEDRAEYNNGLFWHTCHYVDAGRSTHRSYPDAKGVAGGGPGSEHDYTTGLLLHYLLTGSTLSRQTVLDLARWVLAMDDGRRSRWRWLDEGPTGTASATLSSRYHGPGRGAAYSVNTLLDAYRLTGDPVFSAKAEELVRRCVHPKDDIAALDLLDAERRWSYTVFLQVLARYLDDLAERNDLGAMYAYGRDALLHYARWMLEHEGPYLERREILEYPTETWAAQDLRKAEVFAQAARHASGAERARFVERSREFFSYAVSTLDDHVTHALTRPRVLLLNHGYQHAYWELHRSETAPPPACHARHPAPATFVPQSLRLLRRFRRRAA